jgi:F-type H+-transporting ATPase subunit b
MKRFPIALLFLIAVRMQAAPEEAAGGEDKWLVWKVANFIILAIFIGYMLMKHLPPFFKARGAEIQKDIAEAQQTKRDAEKRTADMDARLKTLGAEIEKLRTQAKTEMDQEAARIRKETEEQIAKMQKHAEQEIESAGKTASRELRAYASKLALELAEQRIRTRVDANVESGLVDDFVLDLQKQGSKN